MYQLLLLLRFSHFYQLPEFNGNIIELKILLWIIDYRTEYYYYWVNL